MSRRSLLQRANLFTPSPLAANAFIYMPLVTNNNDLIGGHTATDTSMSYSSGGWFQDMANFKASTSSEISIADASDLSFGNGTVNFDFTFNFFVRFDSFNAGVTYLISKYGSGGLNREYFMYYNPNNQTFRMRFTKQSTGATFDFTSSAVGSFTTGILYMVTFSYVASTNTGTFYLDAVDIGGNSGTTLVLENTSSPVVLGKYPLGTANSLDGYMGEFVGLNIAASAAQISALKTRYNSGLKFA